MPSIPCPGNGSGAFETGFGIELFNGSTPVSLVFVTPDCNDPADNQENTAYLYFNNPARGSKTAGVSAGDSISMKLTQSATKGTLSLTDSTSNLTETLSANDSVAFTDVEVGVINYGAPTFEVTQFTTIRFSSVKFNGMTAAAASAQPFDMVTSGTLDVSTGRLNSTGTGWVNTWVAN
jgi:hypothetical protein